MPCSTVCHVPCVLWIILFLNWFHFMYVWLRFGLLVAITFVVHCSDKIQHGEQRACVQNACVQCRTIYDLVLMPLTTVDDDDDNDKDNVDDDKAERPYRHMRFIGWRGREGGLIRSEVLNVFQKLKRERAKVVSVTSRRKVIHLKIVPLIHCFRLLINCFLVLLNSKI